jgi:NO-binding membrane sensor protein with MHYT domain
MIGYYDYHLVALSVLIAVLASYTALDLAGRTTAARGRVRLTWLASGATAMGVGICIARIGLWRLLGGHGADRYAAVQC